MDLTKNETRKDIKELKRAWKGETFKGKELAPHDFEILQKMLPVAIKADKILDIGAGDGRWIDVLKGQGIEADFYAIDIVDSVRESDANAIIGDARLLPFKDETFDFVYSMGVIEHFPESLIAVKEHARVTKKGGYMLMTVPHFSLATVKRYFRWLMKERRKGSFETVIGRNMRIKELREICENAQLGIINLKCYGWVYIPLLNLSKTFREKVKELLADKWGDYIYVLAKNRV